MTNQKLIFRTGDILLWNSTVFYDLLGDLTLRLGGLHSSMIFVGESFSQFSSCGKSLRNTYVTFQTTKMFPIEEVVGHVWSKPNGSGCYLIQRIEGDNIEEEKSLAIYQDYLALQQVSGYTTAKLAVLAYLNMGDYEENCLKTKSNFGLCSWMVGYFLIRFGILKETSDINSLLPYNFLELNFFAEGKYRKIVIFNKQTMTVSWFMTAPLIEWGFVKPIPQFNCVVEEILGNYNFPRFIGKLR